VKWNLAVYHRKAAITTEQRGTLKAQPLFFNTLMTGRAEVPSRRSEHEDKNDTEQEKTAKKSTLSPAAHHYFIRLAIEVLIGVVFLIPL
jgi:hypothetical protein